MLLPPWMLKDARFNWENPFAFYDFDNDGCTEMAIRFENWMEHHASGHGIDLGLRATKEGRFW